MALTLVMPAVFFDAPFLMAPDRRRNDGEDRSIAFGHVKERLIVVAFTKRQDTIRIISARKANEREKKKFGNETPHRLEKD